MTALRSCASVTKINDKLPIEGTQSAARGWKLLTGHSGIADFTNDQLVSKTYVVGRGIPLGQILTTYGQPDYVWRTEAFNPEKCIGTVSLLFLDRGLAFGFAKEYSCGQDIAFDSSLTPDMYTQFSPGSIDEVLKQAYLQGEASIPYTKSQLRPWTGYDSMKRTPGK